MSRLANITAFVVGLVLLFSIAYGYTYDEYLAVHSQAYDAIVAAQHSRIDLNNGIDQAKGFGLPTASYSTKSNSLLSQYNAAYAIFKRGETESFSGAYDSAYADASSALSSANQIKADTDSTSNDLLTALSAPLQFSVIPAQSTIQAYNGKLTQIVFQISSQDSRIMTCDYQKLGSYSQAVDGNVYQSSSKSFSIDVFAPSTGSGTETISVDVACSVGDPLTSVYVMTKKTASVSLQYQPAPAKTAIKTASDAIDTARSQINSLDADIQGAVAQSPELDAFLGDARTDLASAESALSQAHSNLLAASDSYDRGNPDAALTQANAALLSAQSVNQYVTDGQTKIAQAQEDFKTEGGQTQLAIRSANGSIRSAQMWIDRANGIIVNASHLGMDTKEQIAKVATSKGLLANSQSYLQNANTEFSSNNYANAKIDAANAQNNANESEAKAKDAYETLNSVMQVCQTAYSEMDKTQTEIADADKTYTRLAAVVKNLPPEVNTNATAQDIETQRQKLDKAKNEYSEAQNKISAGYCTQSVDIVIDARNTAADANNLLSRVAERMKDTISSALDASTLQTENTIESAKIATSGAGSTYGANSDKTAAAQKQLVDAQASFSEAKKTVLLAKSATSLGDFLDKAAAAFDKVRAVKETAQTSLDTANSARNDAYVKYGVGAAATIGAGGVGFMFWTRSRKSKPRGKKGASLDKLVKQGKYAQAAELYAKAGKFDKASEMYKKLHAKKRRV